MMMDHVMRRIEVMVVVHSLLGLGGRNRNICAERQRKTDNGDCSQFDLLGIERTSMRGRVHRS